LTGYAAWFVYTRTESTSIVDGNSALAFKEVLLEKAAAAICVSVGVVPLLALAAPLQPHSNVHAKISAAPTAPPERISGLQVIPEDHHQAQPAPTITPLRNLSVKPRLSNQSL
jgi:hypothetical protein